MDWLGLEPVGADATASGVHLVSPRSPGAAGGAAPPPGSPSAGGKLTIRNTFYHYHYEEEAPAPLFRCGSAPALPPALIRQACCGEESLERDAPPPAHAAGASPGRPWAALSAAPAPPPPRRRPASGGAEARGGAEAAGGCDTRPPARAGDEAKAERAKRARRQQGGAAQQERSRLAEAAPEWRTSVLLRNVPYLLSRDMLVELLDSQGFKGDYDLVYLPRDFDRGQTLGYAVVNALTPEIALRLQATFEGFRTWPVKCLKKCSVGWCYRQGFNTNVDYLRNSSVMHGSVPEAFKPAVFLGGGRVPFPEPTKKLKFWRRPKCGGTPVSRTSSSST